MMMYLIKLLQRVKMYGVKEVFIHMYVANFQRHNLKGLDFIQLEIDMNNYVQTSVLFLDFKNLELQDTVLSLYPLTLPQATFNQNQNR